jgi:hypothetical protein
MTLLTLAMVMAMADEPAPDTAAPEPADVQIVVVSGLGWNADGDTAVDGLSAGLLTVRASAVDGVQGALIVATTDGVVDGVQGALVVAKAGAVRGVQGSLVGAIADEVQGVQISGAFTAARHVEGAQLAHGVVVAEHVEGAQVAPVTVANTLDGAQVGLVNVAGRADGVQVGLVNVAKEAHGATIGALNFVGNGYNRVVVTGGSANVANLSAHLGGVAGPYTSLGVGLVRFGEPWWTFGGGMGVHVPAPGPLFFNVEATAWGVVDGVYLGDGVLGKARLAVGVEIGPRVAILASGGLDGWAGRGVVTPQVTSLPTWGPRDARKIWPGFDVGMTF